MGLIIETFFTTIQPNVEFYISIKFFLNNVNYRVAHKISHDSMCFLSVEKFWEIKTAGDIVLRLLWFFICLLTFILQFKHPVYS